MVGATCAAMKQEVPTATRDANFALGSLQRRRENATAWQHADHPGRDIDCGRNIDGWVKGAVHDAFAEAR